MAAGPELPPRVDHTMRSALEARRGYFLDAMGIDRYVPRLALANAQASDLTDAVLVAVSDEQAQIPLPGNVQADSAKVKTPLSDLNLSPAAKPQATTTAAASLVRMHLRAWRVGSELLIIDTRTGDIALPSEALLRNMVLALGFAVAEISRAESLRWPLSEKNHWPLNAAEDLQNARSMVLAFVEAQHSRHGFHTVLLMGADAVRFVLANDGDYAIGQRQAFSEHCNAIILPGLNELLRQPGLKKNSWQAIRHLRRQASY